MNRKQYFVISWFFLGLMFLLIFLHTKLFLEPSLILGSDSFSTSYNIKWAIISILITLCFPLFVLFQILGWLKKEDEKNDDPLLISYVKEKAKLEGNPTTKEELFDLAKTTSKKVEVAEAIEEYYKTGKKHTKDMALLYSVLVASKVGLKKMPKSPDHLWRLAKKEGKLKEVAKEFDKFKPRKK